MGKFLKKPAWFIPESQVTSEKLYLNRRKFLSGMGLGLGSLALTKCLSISDQRILSSLSGDYDCQIDSPTTSFSNEPYPNLTNEFSSPLGFQKFQNRWNQTGVYNSTYLGNRPLTDSSFPPTYNNYYEFSESKEAVANHVKNFNPEPWTLKVRGLVNNELNLDLDDLIKLADLETRVYRHRCVEAWAMTVPWIGYPLSKLLKLAAPTSKAKYVKFKSFHRPSEAPGQEQSNYINFFPYYEGLNLAEAMNELTLLTFGMYDVVLPKQNGAPLRVVVPWKYGYKGPKAVVEIELVETQPPTFWNDLVPHEYSFKSNVNPCIDHPRWSQASERLLGPDPQERVTTQPFNGYGPWVAEMYT